MGKIGQRIILVLLLGASHSLWAQFNVGFKESLQLNVTLDAQLRQPTVGGFSFPQLSEIFLDGDSKADLFVFDRGYHIWRTYVYNHAQLRYDYAPEYEKCFPEGLQEMVLLRDYDCDGYQDIFTYQGGGFKVYRNTGSQPPSFSLIAPSLMSVYGSIYADIYLLPGDIPAITDVDGDGDLDILTFGNVNSENTIEYHQNQSIENDGTCDSLSFIAITQCWGNVEEPPNSSTLVSTSCKGIIPPHGERLHPGSSVLALDMDFDNDLDLVVGDIQTSNVVYAPNSGDAQAANIDVSQQTHLFPNGQDSVNMQYLVSGFSIDVDHDNRQDLIHSVNNRIDSSCNAQHIWYYRDAGTSGKDFGLETRGFLLDDMLDIGSSTVPNLVDVDGDGLDDLLIASSFKRTPATHVKSRLYYFRNTGSAAAPVFQLIDSNFANWSIFGFTDAFPAFGDLDDDGDLDMLVGVTDGSLHLFKNSPIGGQMSLSLAQANYMGISSIGENAAPEFADVDSDGDIDLLVGEKQGTVQYFENTGSASNAAFSGTSSAQKYGQIDVSYYCCLGFAAPRFVNHPAFGSGTYLFIGSSEKKILVYEVLADPNDTFDLVDTIKINAGRLAPTFADVDDDGIVELLTGTGEGGLKYFDRVANFPVGSAYPVKSKSSTIIKDVFPNPAHHLVHITLNTAVTLEISILNSQGGVVFNQNFNDRLQVDLHTDMLPDGIYHLVCTTIGGYESRTIAVIHTNEY